jgi:F0F1-type ATP synthase membrane subunit b/b'
VIFFVLVLAVIVNRLLITPLQRVVEERRERVRSATALAHLSAEKARAVAAEFERRTLAARADVYREMDEKRRAALEARSETLAKTRQEVDSSVAEATALLRAQATEARQRLEQDADALATAVVERVLDRKAS